MMFKETELIQALAAADKAGDVEAARHLAGVIDQQRSEWSQSHGFTDNDIVNKYGLEEAERMRLELGGEYNPAEGMSGERKFATAMGRGIMDVAQGVKQLGLERYDQGAGTDHAGDYTRSKTQELQNYQKLADDSPILTGAGRLIGNAAAAPIPGAGTGAGPLARIGTTAATNMAAAGAEFVPEGGSRARNMGVAGLTGGAMQGVVGEPLRRIANKGINAKAGNLGVDDNVNDAIKFADKNNLPLYYDDVKMDGVAQKLGQQIDEIPIIGGAKSRQVQNEAARGAAEKLKDKFMPDGQLDDLHTAVSKSAQNKLDKARNIATKKYDKAYEQLNSVGEIDLPQVRQKAAELIQEQASKGSMGDSGLVKKLQAIAEAPNGNFQQWAGYRSDLLDTVRSARKGQNTVIGDKASRTLEQMADTINSSLDDAAGKVGGPGGSKWRAANKFYKDTVVQYKQGALHQAMKSGDSEKMLDMLIGVGGGTGKDSTNVAKTLYKGLDTKGKETVRYAMLEKSFNDSLQETGVFSPAKFASRLERFQKRADVFFKPQDKAYIDGLTKYMRFAQNSGDFAANIKTGQKGVGTAYALAAGAGGMINPTGTMASIGGVIGLKKLFRTKRGRSFLLALSKTTDDSRKTADLITKINAYVSRGAGLASAQPDIQSPNSIQETQQ